MLILCEGPDGSGKTTLVAELADALRTTYPTHLVEVRRCGVPPPDSHPLDLYATPLLSYRPGSGHHVIYDRLHVGEWVYPAVLGRPTRADEPSWRWLDLLLASRGALLVHGVADVATLVTNVVRRGDDLVSPEQLAAVATGYAERLLLSRLPRFDHRLGDAFAVAEIIARARQTEYVVRHLTPFVTYAGPARPAYLLLGDVRRPLTGRVAAETSPEHTRHLGPAFGPYPGTSGHYLLQNLPEDLLARGVGLANACDVDDVATLLVALDFPRTAVLGANAYRCVMQLLTGPGPEARFGSAPHPQFMRRFHYDHGFSYGSVLRSALEDGRHELKWRP